MGTRRKLIAGGLIVGAVLLGSYFALRWHLDHKYARMSLMSMRESDDPNGYIPPQGLVPDKTTAISIAVAVWKPLFGEEAIDRQAPYQATLVDDIWVVRGTGPGRRLRAGGNAHAFIKKDTGEILSVYHEM